MLERLQAKPEGNPKVSDSTDTFRGLLWEPSNEQEVVLLFGRLLHLLPRPLAIEFVQTGFPDCKARDLATHEVLWIEFELHSSHYRRDHHKANSPRLEKCDWIVCWRHDEKNVLGLPPVTALKDLIDAQPNPGEYIRNRRPPGATHEEYFHSRVRALPEHHQHVIRRLLGICSRQWTSRRMAGHKRRLFHGP